AGEAALKPYADERPRPGQLEHATAGNFNGMIAPLIPFAIKGVAWYQGEANANKPTEYRTLLPTLIGDWRGRWDTDFPVLVVQLSGFDAGSTANWAELREAQALTAKNVQKVGLVVTTDLGDAKDIHPPKKEPVGARL